MDKHSQQSKRVLPNTPRVSDKIMEYYQKFGHDRDLEKFMRLYSPANSQDSQKTQSGDCGAKLDSCCKHTKSRETISSTSSCEALAMMPSRPLSVCGVTNSKSLPNIDVQGQAIREGVYFTPNDVIVDINIETEGDKEKILSISTENLETPKKIFKTIKTQTPESVAKTHRRLEWDSLGDVGYIKSMSTSNISTMERFLLREFFKENSVVSEPGTCAAASEMQHLSEKNKTVKKLKANEIEHSTPPLACSTLVETTKRSTNPKMVSQSTSSTSLHEKFEKYAQTSLIKPTTVHSQEIQCTMSSSNSIIEGTVTPSSFECYSSRSSKSRSSKSSDLLANTSVQKQINPLEHPFIASITDLLLKRKALGEKNQQQLHQFNNIRELQTKFQAALDENKENQSHSTINSTTASSFSLSKQAPELDLGIQLICSLIDAKSVNGRQKKQLIRDIVKRITRLESGDQTNNSTTINSTAGSTTNSSDCNRRHIYDSVRSNISSRHKQVNMAKFKVASELGVTPLTSEQACAENPSTSSSSSRDNVLVAKKTKASVSSKPVNTAESLLRFQLHQDKGHYKQFPCKTKNQCENTLKENNTNVSSVGADTISKETQSEIIMSARSIKRDKSKEEQTAHSKKLTEAPQTKDSRVSTEKRTSRSTQTSRTTTSTSSTTSETTTPDLTTQKCMAISNNELNNSNTDADQPTMREWLNPLTQSEIEYEEKKRQELKKKAAVQRENLLKKSTKDDSGRAKQLNWIENEIKRLECLKHLLLKDETTARSSSTVTSTDCTAHNDRNLTKNSTQTDKLYDTVYSDKSSVLSESAERLVQEIEIILEESHEDVVNLKDNFKRTKDRKKETQIMYEKEVDDSSKEERTKSKPKYRTLKESINISEEQLLNVSEPEMGNQQRQQREKIDTPHTDKSQESESLRDLVQQRKREFMAAYKTKKQHHYEALKLQQKEDFKYLNIQRQMHEKLANTDSEHYSVPHTLPRKYVSNDVSYPYSHHPLPLTPAERESKLKSQVPKRQHITYSTAAIGQQQNNPHIQCAKAIEKEIVNTTAGNTNSTTTSSSSMFCMSSDVSVPMGSQNTSSTPTTTHQYDDVAAAAAAVVGVAVQTSDSVMRSKPIYGPKRPSPKLMSYNASASSSTAACVQVKPKSIAYVIEFSDNKHAATNSPSNSDVNSNDLHAKTNVSDELAHNCKALLPTEPQLTLQEHLEKSKPKFLQQSKERKAILNQLQSMRQERDRQLREIIENTSFNSLDRRLQYLPPPPIQKVRILNTKEMKALTNKRFSSLPEVVARQERELEEKKRRGNRILRDVFNRRLQKRVRSGKLSLNHSKTVI